MPPTVSKIPFTVSARTARLIGRENVAHAEGAVIELVKNCYDADADFSLVVVNRAKRTIIIFDNGHGMSDSDIRDRWMNIGTNNKEVNFRSTGGRIKAGAKGIGRFALDRLGQKCTMYTLPERSKNGYKWAANWNDFEVAGASIDKVYATLEDAHNLSFIDLINENISNPKITKLLSRYSLKKGTLLKIELCRDDWNEEISEKIFRSLEILTPPDGQTKFDIFFINETYPSQFGKIENESFDDYDYKIEATYKKNKEREVIIHFHRNEFDYNLIPAEVFEREDMTLYPYDKRTFKKETFSISTSFYDLMPGFREVEKNKLSETIGDFSFTLYYYKLASTSDNSEIFKYKSFNSAFRKKWAARFGGIKLFRDNFRVRPYGEANTASYDWMMLGERHAINPAGVSRAGDFRIRPNQVAGTIQFSRTSELFLVDKSGREGLIENDTFQLFKNLLEGIIAELEEDRSTIASNLSSYFEEVHESEKNEEEALNIAESEDEAQSEEEAKSQNRKLKKGIQSQKSKLKANEDELVMSRAMASAGILIASFAHEFNYIKNKLNSRSTNLKNALLPLLPETKVKGLENRKNPYHLINLIKDLDEKVRMWIEFSITLTRKDRRKAKKIDLKEYFEEFKRTWKRKLEDRGISLNISYASSSELSVRMIALDIDTIFDNLIANSIEAFQRDGFKGNRIVSISLANTGTKIELEYKDSGPGLSKDIKKPEDIFKAFVTTKRDKNATEVGTGLGMWLLKSAVDYNKGGVQLFAPDKGFHIKINLKSVTS